MSDSDNASDFESADEGDDSIGPISLPLKMVASPKEIVKKCDISGNLESAIIKSAPMESNILEEDKKAACVILQTKEHSPKDKRKQNAECLSKEKSCDIKKTKKNKNKQEKILQASQKELEEQKQLPNTKGRNRRKNKKQSQNVESREEKSETIKEIGSEHLKSENQRIEPEKIEVVRNLITEQENNELVVDKLLESQIEENISVFSTEGERNELLVLVVDKYLESQIEENVYVYSTDDETNELLVVDKLPESQIKENASASSIEVENERLSCQDELSTCIEENVVNVTEGKLVINSSDNNDFGSNTLIRESKESSPTRSIHGWEESQLSEEESRVLDKLANLADKKESQSGGWGWGNWGASLLSTATASVTTFTSQVGQGFVTVLETMEGTLGAPSPEELALTNERKIPENNVPTTENESDKVDNSSGPKIPLPGADILISGVSNLTSVIHTTGKHFVTGSLDALETIGKKTMDVLQEGDPGLKKKRALFQTAKGDLSQILREAKEKAEAENLIQEEQQENRKANFGIIFDGFQGLVHLEALEMLSSQSDSKVKATMLRISGDKLNEITGLFEQISENSLLDEIEENIDENTEHEFIQLISEALETLNLGTSPEKLILVQSKARTWLDKCKKEQDKGIQKEAQEIHENGITSLAELTARTIQQLHKNSELLLLKTEAINDHVQQAASLTKLTKVLCTEIGILSAKYAECLNTAADDSPEPDSITHLITDMYLEASNSSTYIQDAFQLTIPVLQLATLTALC